MTKKELEDYYFVDNLEELYNLKPAGYVRYINNKGEIRFGGILIKAFKSEKKEFNDNLLEHHESKPSQKGHLMNHQEMVSKYLSIITPYDGLLLYHEMGSGKKDDKYECRNGPSTPKSDSEVIN